MKLRRFVLVFMTLALATIAVAGIDSPTTGPAAPPSTQPDPFDLALQTIAQRHADDQASVQSLGVQVAQQRRQIGALQQALAVAATALPAGKTGAGNGAASSAPRGWLGTNIAGNSYFGTDAKWADITHQATGWYNIPATPDAAILTDQYGGKTIAPAYFTADGYPLCPAQADIYPTGYPTGDYTVTYDGSGTLSYGSAVKFTPNAAGNGGIVTISNLSQPVRLTLSATDPKNPLRNLHILCPGYQGQRDKATKGQSGQTAMPSSSPSVPSSLSPSAPSPLVFRKEYTGLLSHFSCVRTMDAQDTNANDDVKWSDRVTPTQWCQTGNQHGLRGMALEYLVAMANEAHVDLWVNIPINADADYVAHMAQVCHGCKKRVHVEYGNEVWNSTMPLCQKSMLKLSDDPAGAFNYDGTINNGQIAPYLDESGNPRLGTDSLTRAARCTVERARANAIIFRQVFADRPGALRCVWAAQAAWDAWARNGLEWEAAKFGNTAGGAPGRSVFNELAIAPYFMFNWKPAYFPAADGTLDQIFAGVDQFFANDLPGQLDSHAALAQKYGLKLVCYESGQSFWPQSDIQQQLVADPTGKSITDITYLAQLDPRMGAAYDRYLSILHAHGVTHCEHYTFIGSWNKFSYFAAWRSLADVNPRTVSLLAECRRSN